MFNEPALNGFDERRSAERNGGGAYRIIERRAVPVCTLASLLDRYLPHGQSIDFMTIDVEGLDTQVVQSNDWEKFRPRFLLVEIDGQSVTEIIKSETAVFMASQGYFLCCRTRLTAFFQDSRTTAPL